LTITSSHSHKSFLMIRGRLWERLNDQKTWEPLPGEALDSKRFIRTRHYLSCKLVC
jgi:hypothetical protein